ncbi:MAG: WXG100 family type VII secretion target [Propionibacteriaceae bacterium]|jgi:WXG100 family type VII secretion target|nr:WXG100 family type VII secretion target [Propionibacteriaceae bacterium]
MANLNVSYDDMSNAARGLRAGKENLNSELERLRQQIDNLVSSGFVTDRASVAFQSDYEQYNQGAKSTVDALEDIATRLDQTAQALAETDAALAGQG